MFQKKAAEEPGRTIRLSRADAAAARRLLRLLLDGDQSASDPIDREPIEGSAPTGDRAILVARARAQFDNRRRRIRMFGQSMFGEAAWDMLLALYIMEPAGARETVGNLMRRAGTPITTANRWLGFLVAHGLVRRVEHPTDRRTSFVSLTDTARTKMDEYFSGTVTPEV